MGRPMDIRADIYSLAVTLFSIITGKLPFQGRNLQALLISILETTPSIRMLVSKGYPGEFTRLLKSMMSKEPGLRPTSADEIINRCRFFFHQDESLHTIPQSTQIHLYSPPLIGRRSLLTRMNHRINFLKRGKPAKLHPGPILIPHQRAYAREKKVYQ